MARTLPMVAELLKLTKNTNNMKNWMLMIAVASTLVFAASCNKDENGDYVCTCRDSAGDVKSSKPFENANLVDAQDACSDSEDQLNDAPLDPETYICRID